MVLDDITKITEDLERQELEVCVSIFFLTTLTCKIAGSRWNSNSPSV